MQALKERGDELKLENEKLLPIGLVDSHLFNRKMRMAQTAGAGFGLKKLDDKRSKKSSTGR